MLQSSARMCSARVRQPHPAPVMPPDATRDGSKQCPIGSAAGCGGGGRCPMTPRTFDAGVTLAMEGADAERIWYVQHGSLALFREGREQDGAGIPWAVRRVGSLVGEEGLVQGAYADTAVTLTPVTLCVASRDSFARWIEQVGADASMAVMGLVIQSRCAEGPRPTAAAGSAVQRVAQWLADESRGGTAPKIQRRVVAGLLGMLPETFSRALARLVALGAIETTRKEIRVLDPKALLAAAEE